MPSMNRIRSTKQISLKSVVSAFKVIYQHKNKSYFTPWIIGVCPICIWYKRKEN